MRVGGLTPCSLSDYPGKVAAVVFTQGCNFCCPFCHNGALIPMDAPASDLVPPGRLTETLDARRGCLDGVVLSGGEPTLQPELPRFARWLKRCGFQVKLDTNGSQPEVVRQLLADGLLDFVAMDIKAPWRLYDRLAGRRISLSAIRQSIDLIAGSGIEHQFRTTAVRELLSEEDLQQITEMVPTGSPHRFQPFQREHAQASWLRENGTLTIT